MPLSPDPATASSATARARRGPGRVGLGKLGLGFGRLGAAGASARGRAGEADAFAALAFATDCGLRHVDAGRAGSGAEALLGRVRAPGADLQVSVRTSALGPGGVEEVERRARASLAHLDSRCGDTLLVRAADDLLGVEGEALWRRVRVLQAQGLFARIGVCARAADDPAALARRFKPDVMQLPASLLDQRLVRSGALAEVAAQGVEVRLRSIFLEGLIFLPREGLPAQLKGAGPRLSRIRRALAEAGADPLHASLAFALGRPEASVVTVGVASCAELRAVVAAAGAPAPALDWSALALDFPPALDSHLWARAAA